MVLRVVFQQITGRDIACLLSFCRSAHALPLPTPVNHSIDTLTVLLRFSLLQNELSLESSVGFQLPHFAFGGGSMELMAVPKRKVSPHKRGMRNGPKALKPIPVIICCKNCGAVRLPHFYCCGGRKEGQIEK